jgi:hypothetical protein
MKKWLKRLLLLSMLGMNLWCTINLLQLEAALDRVIPVLIMHIGMIEQVLMPPSDEKGI